MRLLEGKTYNLVTAVVHKKQVSSLGLPEGKEEQELEGCVGSIQTEVRVIYSLSILQ